MSEFNIKINFLLCFLVLVVSVYYIFLKTPSSCNLEDPSNRTFDKYYGISTNYFDEVNAESDNNPFFEGVVPDNLFAKNSFILVAKRGGGKTAIRKRYIKSRTSTFLIEIFNKQANSFLKNFVDYKKEQLSLSDKEDYEIIEKNWNSNDFEDTVTYLFVDSILKSYPQKKEIYKKMFKQMVSQDEKLQFSTIICLYASYTHIMTLEELLNELWLGGNWIHTKIDKYPIEIKHQHHKRTELKQTYKELETLQDKINVIERTQTNLNFRKGIELLHDVLEEFKMKTNVVRNQDKILILSEIFKKYLNLTPLVVIDSLDEVSYFFNEKKINDRALEVFIKSSLNQVVISKAFDGTVNLVYLFPLLENINVSQFIERRDKIPFVNLVWSEFQLKNYADFLLSMMRSKQRNHCQTLPDFYSLLDYDNHKEGINNLKTPRELNIFMQELIILLNGESSINSFKPNSNNIETAIDKTEQRFIVNN